MIQPELPLPGVNAPARNDTRTALLVGTYRTVFDYVTQAAKKNLGTVLLGYAHQGMGTLLGAVARELANHGGSFMFRCCPEDDSFNQIGTFAHRLAPGILPRRKSFQCHADHIEVCVQRIVTDEIKFLIVHRVDLAAENMKEFLDGVVDHCAKEGKLVIPIIGQRVTHSDDPVCYEASARMPLKMVMPAVDLNTVLPFVSNFCSGGQAAFDLLKTGDGEMAKAFGRLVDHCDGLMAKLVNFCHMKEALFPGDKLTADKMEFCISCLKEPLNAIELLAATNRGAS